MPSVEELQDTVEAALTLAGVDAETIERHPSATIVPPTRRPDTAGERAFSVLAELRPGSTAETEKLDLHGTIGEGGMGVVRLGTQRALGREVAVKTLKAEHRDERSTLKLLREAWVTGALEHPNVVPVYDLALESDGSPLVVLKRIEGDAWGSLMHDPGAIKERFGVDDPLGWNLRILLQVCNAVRFAHSRGILHRDLKPENVMIGPFGEVYLVDWGIAVSLRDDGSGRLPLARAAKEMAGTPLYMAPEMLGARGESRLSERSDVYLLGAVLYEIVTGRPPHRGETLMQIVSSIVESDPPIPDDVPAELARVVRVAMDPDPDARFENAEQLRLAVQAFLEHRDAARLADRARERLRELEALLEAHAAQHDDPEAREPIYHLFGECRFGFRHALEVWPDNADARAGLERAIGAMVEYELAQGEPEAARALLGEMRDAPGALVARVDEARRARQREDERARRLRADLDPMAGRRTRVFLGLIFGALWTVSPLVSHYMVQAQGWTPDPWYGVGVSTVFLALAAALGLWARESMTRTRINRQLGVAAILGILTPLCTNLHAGLAGAAPWAGVEHALLVWAAIAASTAAAVDWRLLVAAATYALTFVALGVAGPRYGFFGMAISNFVLLVNVLVLWARPNEDLKAARENMERRQRQRRRWLARRLERARDSDAS